MAIAQDQHWCAQTEMQRALEENNPGYAELYENALEHSRRVFAENPAQRGGVVTIPIVFHVVWNTAAENISDNLITQQVAKLNFDFSTAYQNTQVTQFANVAANPMIQFCLATTDPSGDPTTGITRTQTSVTQFSLGNDMKSNSSGGKDPWPFSDYYNVWTCDIGFNGSGTAGYAYLPGLGPSWEAVDGAVMSYNVIGPNETTLSHESGHYLGLEHPWGNTEACNSDDDGFSDTPEVDSPNFFCPTSHSSCGSLDNIENFMDYSSCPTMFTTQQVAFMQSILATNYSWQQGQVGRASLQNSDGCAGGNPVAPVADFTANQTVVAVGSTVLFTDLSSNTPTDWDWDFGDGGTANGVQNPSYQFNNVGQWDIELTATNGAGSDTETKIDYITVTAGGNVTTCDSLVYLDGRFIAQINPIDAPSFTASLFDEDGLEPNPATNFPTAANGGSGWLNFYEEVLPGDTNWSWGATSYFDPQGAGLADNWITFGPISIPSDGADLFWNHAYFSNSWRDGYEVVLNLNGTDPSDFSGGTVLFSVDDNDPTTDGNTVWTPQTVNLPSGTYAGQSVYIGFHHNADDMWTLFLDEIYMEGCNTSPVSVDENELEFLVYPNPSNGIFRLDYRNSTAGNLQLEVFNALGQQVLIQNLGAASYGKKMVDLRENVNGIYTMVLSNNSHRFVRRLMLNK